MPYLNCWYSRTITCYKIIIHICNDIDDIFLFQCNYFRSYFGFVRKDIKRYLVRLNWVILMLALGMGLIRTTPSIHRLCLRLLGYLIPFCSPSFCPSVLVSSQQSAFAVGVLLSTNFFPNFIIVMNFTSTSSTCFKKMFSFENENGIKN